MGFFIEYIIGLRDQFSAAADKISASSAKTKGAIHAMGNAATATEAKLDKLAAGMSAVGRAQSTMVASGKGATTVVGNLGKEAEKTRSQIAKMTATTRANSDAEIAAFRAAAQERVRNKFSENPRYKPGGDRYSGPPPGSVVTGGMGGGITNKLLNAYFGAAILSSVGRGIDSLVQKSADVDTLRRKISIASNSKAGDMAVEKAMELSGKYMNTTVEENLKIIDDLRANLPHKVEHIIEKETEPFVKMHSFFKAWEGGKHAGTAEKSLKAITAAIRSGELTGQITGDLMAKHTQSLSAAQIVFGDKFNMQQYLQGAQKSSMALAASNDTFKYVDFPVLLQALGPGGAVALRGIFDKIVNGNKVTQATAETWRALGLVNMNNVEFDKHGKIKANALLGKRWLKDSDAFGENLTDTLMTKVVPALVKKGGLKDLAGLDKAWVEGDVDKATEILTAFRSKQQNMVHLSRQAAALAKDPKAGQALEELIIRSSDILLRRKNMQEILKLMEEFVSYEKAKQEVGAQANRMWQALSGKEFVPWVTGKMHGLAGGFSGMADFFKANEWARTGAKWAGIGAGMMIVVGALRALSTMSGLGHAAGYVGMFARAIGGLVLGGQAARTALMAASMTRLAGAARLLVGMTGIGAALFIGYEVYQNWDKIAGAVERTWNALKQLFQGDTSGVKAIGNDVAKSLSLDKETLTKETKPGKFVGSRWGHISGAKPFSPAPSAGAAAQSATSAAVQRVQVESKVRTTLDPLTIKAPNSIQIEVRGRVDAIQGSGSIPMSATAPRGQSTAEPAAPPVSK